VHMLNLNGGGPLREIAAIAAGPPHPARDEALGVFVAFFLAEGRCLMHACAHSRSLWPRHSYASAEPPFSRRCSSVSRVPRWCADPISDPDEGTLRWLRTFLAAPPLAEAALAALPRLAAIRPLPEGHFPLLCWLRRRTRHPFLRAVAWTLGQLIVHAFPTAPRTGPPEKFTTLWESVIGVLASETAQRHFSADHPIVALCAEVFDGLASQGQFLSSFPLFPSESLHFPHPEGS